MRHGIRVDYRGSSELNSEPMGLYSLLDHVQAEPGLSILLMSSPQKDFDTHFGPGLIELWPTSDS